MSTTLSPKPSISLLQAYQKFYTVLRVRQAKLCFGLAMFLVPACVGLDYFIYPTLAWPMFKARLWCDLAMVPFFLSIFTSWGREHIRYLDSTPLIFACLTICWMIYRAEGGLSPYYAGLNIVLAAAIMLIPYTLLEATIICAFILASYTAACMLHQYHPPAPITTSVDNIAMWPTLVNNYYFISMTVLIALASNHFQTIRRFQEFSLRHELDENNIELASTLKKLKDTEVQLVQSEKMNALGKLSAGLLHEINNPLNFTFMALQMAEQDAGDNATLKETLADIGQGMTRIRSVISDLRSFAYPSKISEENEFSLEEALVTAKRLTAHEVREIPIDSDGLKNVTALGTKTQIVHVFMNLLVNAAHALQKVPAGRTAKIEVLAKNTGERVQITVRDNGTGVEAANIPRLFEPFFTTKDPGQGTGLGLSISHTIIKNHGGEMNIASELGEWTEVSFDLPLPAARRLAA